MLRASILNSLLFDPFSFFNDGAGPAEVGVGGRDVFEALVEALMVVVVDEGVDLALKVAGIEVVFEQDPVIDGLVPTLNLALSLGMAGCPAHMAHNV